MSLVIRPITLRAANAYVDELHRHHKPARGWLFGASVLKDDERLCGVIIVGRPARLLQDGVTCEVTRCCTDGTRNACSKLYATAAKMARILGYERILTYTLPEEGGASLRAAGWIQDEGVFGGGRWSRTSRPREDDHPLDAKHRWRAWPEQKEIAA